jgi:hypothetical protein
MNNRLLRNPVAKDGVTVFGIENHAIEKAPCIGFDADDPESATYTFVDPEYAIRIAEEMIRETKATINGERWKAVSPEASN